MGLSDSAERFITTVFVGIITSMVAAFISWIRERAEQRRTNRENQVAMATEICTHIIEGMDKVFSHMKRDALGVAWRKALPEGHPVELLDPDKERWKEYLGVLSEWRSKEISFETQLKAFFGEKGSEAKLFLAINTQFDMASKKLWDIYYYSSSSKGTSLSAEDEQKSKEEFDAMFRDMGGEIKVLSGTMIHCIQIMHIGNLRGPPEPLPDDWPVEARLSTSEEKKTLNV